MNLTKRQISKFGILAIVILAAALVAVIVSGVQILKSVRAGNPLNASYVAVLIFASLLMIGLSCYLLFSKSGKTYPIASAGVMPKWRPKFGLWSIMLITLVAAVTAAAASYLRKTLEMNPHDSEHVVSSRVSFILFALIAPMTLLVIVSVVHTIIQWRNRPNKGKKQTFIEVD